MAALLAAEGVALRPHLLEDVAIADGSRHDVDAVVLHRDAEAEVGHHCRDHGVARERASVAHAQGEDGQDLVAVDDIAFRVDREATIRVTIMRDADVGSMLDNGRDEVVQVSAAAALIDVEAVRRRMDGHHARARAAHGLGRHR